MHVTLYSFVCKYENIARIQRQNSLPAETGGWNGADGKQDGLTNRRMKHWMVWDRVGMVKSDMIVVCNVHHSTILYIQEYLPFFQPIAHSSVPF